MASDTNTKKTNKAPKWTRFPARPAPIADLDRLMDLYWGGPERRITRLTLRIIGVNFLALIALTLGVLYLGEYEKRQIATKLNTFNQQSELMAAAFSANILGPGEKNTTDVNLDKAATMALQFSALTGQRIYLFNPDGTMLLDSFALPGGKQAALRYKPFNFKPEYESIKTLKDLARFILQIIPDRKNLPAYPTQGGPHAQYYPDAVNALHGDTSITAWELGKNGMVLSAGAPLFHDGKLAGALMLTRDGQDIIKDVGDVWLTIVQIFLITLIITILLSIYLSGTITRPLRKLTSSAEAIRLNKAVQIPDLSERKDEIGELSLVLRALTQALQERMESIEHFAADVAHELKNPLTSLKSAIETVTKVTKKSDREKLIGIINHDIERLDRLITDISHASRLDAEIARESFEKINLTQILQSLARRSAEIAEKQKRKITIHVEQDLPQDIYVWGIESRITQIFDNLIANALSFSKDGHTIRLKIHPATNQVSIMVEDQGPGIPSSKLETIFERFYTERPADEAYGSHSGLGLSICHKITKALGGQIFADNIKDGDTITGARFTVILKNANK